MPNRELSFSMQRQQQTQWCWAANATSISKYYDFHVQWTQCKLACNCLNRTDCCDNPAPCNIPYYLNIALERTNNLRNFITGTLAPSSIRDEINAGWVIGVRIGWRNAGGHFVTIHGYDDTSEEMFVYISDPIYGKSYLKLTDFANRYIGQGEWTHTYLITANNPMLEYTQINKRILEKARTSVPDILLDRIDNLITSSDQSELGNTMPHNSFIIDFDTLKNKDEIELIADGVRLIDQNENGQNMIFEFAGSGADKLRFKQVIYGDEYSDNYQEILANIKDNFALTEEVYTISVVRQPQLKVDAIRIFGREEKYVPLIDNGFLKRGATYSLEVFSDLLIQSAKKQVQSQDDLLGG